MWEECRKPPTPPPRPNLESSVLECRIYWLLDWKYDGGPNDDKYRIQFNHPAARTTAIDIVDHWSRTLLGRLLPENERTSIIEFMAHGRAIDSDLPAEEIDERLRYMIGLIFMSPSFQVR